MICIVGLGNPGKKYQTTHHNYGFLALDEFVRVHLPQAKWQLDKKQETEVIEDSLADQKLLLLKPQTFMNNSGKAVKALCQHLPLETNHIWVIHDDIDLDLGVIRVRLGGTAAGHKGVQSVIDHLGTANFWRIRLGIGPLPPFELEHYVTMSFTAEELPAVAETNKKIAELLVQAITTGGLQEATYEVA
ncbi:MAG: aminoacyl-tRNA hydrolase [Candidatus Abawacabacteria bacterium RIFCSPHIGHO2_01_FULL_46_8]|uniref:Peptidyl-tRNA hydrolase n=1 Tax=Candidatus Abawacabacteria bacterium RIFCSPHIGHO2_01_FULL_46_8 TaxID=1817815 RepID=A0A1F4XM62_9BACT|nr:MAG: aminoacyl-tRNA hydrolase [Candidatus Abawacabacteria bacterium RIFCSPHIGHO2_01_FULL_46_8]